MTPIKTKAATSVLTSPNNWDTVEYGACDTLPVAYSNGVWYSYWRLSWKERFLVLIGRPVRLAVLQYPGMPPVALEMSPKEEV